jgi:hypothetical protein
MDPFELPGLDISALLNKTAPDPSNQTSAVQGTQFQVRDTSVFEEVQQTDSKAPEKTEKTEKTAEAQKQSISAALHNQIAERDEEEAEVPAENNTDSSPVKALASFLKEKGIIEYTDEELRDEDDFISESVQKTISKQVDEYKNSLPEEIKQLVELYEDGVPLGALLEKEREIFEYSQVDITKIKDNINLQKTLVNNFYSEIGESSEEIKERIQEFEDSGILEKEATRALNKLKIIQEQQKQDIIAQTQQQKKMREDRYREQLTRLQDTLKNTKEFIPGIATNEAEKKAVFEGITKFSNGKNKVMEFMDKPENYVLISYIANALKGDFSKLKKATTTQALNDIKSTISSTPKKSVFSGVDQTILKKIANQKVNF